MIIRDQLNREINLPDTIERIVCLVPSITEFICSIRASDLLVGVTKYCIHPIESTRSIPKIGGTKNPDISKIRQLRPQLIIANKEENQQEHIQALGDEFLVYCSDIATINDAFQMMRDIGNLIGKTQETTALLAEMTKGLQAIKDHAFTSLNAVYLIWHKPIMAAGADTYISHVLELMGIKNAVQENRYPALTQQQLSDIKPDLVLLSSEPYPFNSRHLSFYQSIFPKAQVLLVDGEIFSWYGSKILNILPYLLELRARIFAA